MLYLSAKYGSDKIFDMKSATKELREKLSARLLQTIFAFFKADKQVHICCDDAFVLNKNCFAGNAQKNNLMKML